jgi:hypothetical protein
MLLLLVLPLATARGRPDTTGSVDSATHPIRCHWERSEDEARCEDLLGYLELAWDVQVDGMGFAAPPPDNGEGGSDDLDLYLTPDGGGAGSAWVMCDWDDGGCVDTDPDDGWASAPSWIAIDSATPDEDLPSYSVHEFNHACQYAMDYAEPFLVVWEASAVAAEAWTWPETHPSVSDIADYQATPWVSAVLQDGYMLWDDYGVWSYYEYGSVIWLWWLDHSHGEGTGSIAPELWVAMTQEGYGSEPDLLDAWDAVAGDWRGSFLDFTADRARMGGEDGPEWLAFAGADGRAARAADEVTLPAELTPAMAPYPLGAVFYDVQADVGDHLILELESSAEVDWALLVVEPGGGQTIAEGTSLEHGPLASGTATVIVANLGPPGMDADDVLRQAELTLRIQRSGGCGCSSGRSSDIPLAWTLLASLGLCARRRERG